MVEDMYESAVLSGDKDAMEHHRGQVERDKERLKKFGIEADNYLDALEKYQELRQSWERSEKSQATGIQAEWETFCGTKEREDIEAYLQNEGLTGKPESSYALYQKAEINRIKNKWQDAKKRNIS